MEINIVTLPKDSMWWIIRPEFIAYIDKIYMDKKQFKYEEDEKERSGFHKVAWERLNILLDNNMLDLIDINIDDSIVENDTNNIFKNIYRDSSSIEQFIDDLIFSYKYWIDFNILKIKLLPDNQEYSKLIKGFMTIWERDLKSLEENRKEALNSRPDIIDNVGRNIIKKIVTMNIMNEDLKYYPMSSLKEYEPFTKWLPNYKEKTYVTEKIILSYKNSLINVNNKFVNLPLEPEYDFLRFKLEKQKFNRKIKEIKETYKVIKYKFREILSYSEELLFGIYESKWNQSVTNDLMILNKELSESTRKASRRSKYLSKAFGGLSFIPIPVLSQVLNGISLTSDEISRVFQSIQLTNKGIRSKGLKSYLSFLESMLNYKIYDKFPQIVEQNKEKVINTKTAPFWRIND